MKIVVCVKQVGYIYHSLAIDVKGAEIDPEKMVFMLNPYDEIAVEEAIRIKERLSNCEVIIITTGSSKSEEALRYSFAFGADRMIRIEDQNFGCWSTAMVLAEVIKDLDYDLILCGKKSIDTNGNNVASFLAELLDIPQVSGIVRLETLVQEKKAIVDRYLGRGDREVVECDLPALFTVENGLNNPRYPSLPHRISAEKEKIEVLNLRSLGVNLDQEMDLTEFMSLSPPRPKPKKRFTPDSNLSAGERMRLIMSGGVSEKKSDLLEGKSEDIADRIVEVLIQEKIL